LSILLRSVAYCSTGDPLPKPPSVTPRSMNKERFQEEASSPVAGIDKAFPAPLGRVLPAHNRPDRRTKALARSPCSASSTTKRLPRSCALRRGTQTDEDDLMPYPVLDAIIERFQFERNACGGGLRSVEIDPVSPGPIAHLGHSLLPPLHRDDGSASATHHRSTSTTKSDPRPGADFRFFRVDLRKNCGNWQSLNRRPDRTDRSDRSVGPIVA